MRKKTFVLLGLSTHLLALPSLGLATEDEAEGQTELAAITVTANKVEENLLNVPQSVTVLDSLDLEERSIKSMDGIMRQIPNMTYVPVMGKQMNFRGLNTSQFTLNNPVVFYIDGIPQTNSYGFDANLANVERIEVLRGPQGTLYGKDAIGGVINIVTKKPDNIWTGHIGAEYGSDNYIYGTFGLSGPVVEDKIYFGLNGQIHQDDGWISNNYPGMDGDANAERDNKINGFMLLTPTDRFTARLAISRDYYKKDWMDGYNLNVLQGFDPITGAPIFVTRPPDRDKAENVSFDVPTYDRITIDSQALSLRYDFDAVAVESVTTHKKMKERGSWDMDYAANLPYLGMRTHTDQEVETWTQELRLSSQNKEGIRWVGGLYFDHDKSEQGPYGNENYPMTGMWQQITGELEGRTLAAFGQVMIPFAERFELTLGGRYQHIKKEANLHGYLAAMGSTTPMMDLLRIDDDTSWDRFLPKVALSYRINDNFTTFAVFSQGYMPGGYNNTGGLGGLTDNKFEPQISTNYEIGVKASYDKLYLGASLFYMDIEDAHVYRTERDPMWGSFWATDNADSAHAFGAELEFRYLINEMFILDGAFGVIQAEYDDYVDRGLGVDYDGEKIQNTPSHTARLGLSFEHPTGVYSRFDIRNIGKVHFFDGANARMVSESSYTTADLKVGYRFSGWDVYGIVKNITDEEYVDSYRSTPMNALVTFGDPRYIGVGLRYSF